MTWLGYRRAGVWLVRISLTLTILLMLTVLGLVRWLVVDLPSPNQLYERAAAPSTRIYDRHGRLIYEILDPHGGAHTPTSLEDIPSACVSATIATEDASFFHNPGVDMWAILRALWINVRGGEILSGGSTITQQLARNLLLSPEERTEISLERKLREAILAWRLARNYSKDEILTSIFNLFTSEMEGTVLTEEEIDERISALSPEEFWKVGTSRFMAATGDPRMEKISLIVFQEMFRDGRARDIALRELFSRQQELVELIFTKMKGRGIVGQVDTKALANAYSYPMLALRFEYNLLKFWGMDTGPVEEKMAQHIRFIAGVARPQDELN